MAENKEQIYTQLIEVGLELSEERDLDTLLHKVVDKALLMSRADACTLYVIQNEVLEFKITRNLTLEQRELSYPSSSFQLNLDSNTVAGHVAVTGKTLNIPDVHDISDGYDFKFDQSSDTKLNYMSKSMLVLPLKDFTGSVVGVLQMINHKQDGQITAFPKGLISPLKIIANQSGIAIRNAILVAQLCEAQNETVYRLGMAAETRDQETGNHLKRMSRYSCILAKAAGLDEEYQNLILNAAPLHDVGKIGIPDEILQKNGKLDEEEWRIMRTHPDLGYQILKGSNAPLLEMGAKIALSHHEKVDGSGYPKGLKGEDIPLEGRITAIADVFDALTSRRYYKNAWELNEVKEYMISEKGKHFDSKLVDLFFKEMPQIMAVYGAYKD